MSVEVGATDGDEYLARFKQPRIVAYINSQSIRLARSLDGIQYMTNVIVTHHHRAKYIIDDSCWADEVILRMDFFEYLEYMLGLPLPGRDAHVELVPDYGDVRIRLTPPPDDARPSAVILPLVASEGVHSCHIILTRRSFAVSRHSGQISFPGGVQDIEESLQQCALRELREEIGVAPNRVRLLGSLTPVYIPPSNSAVVPFVGLITGPVHYNLNPSEVQELLSIPLSTLMNPQTRKKKMRLIRDQHVNVPYYDIHPEEQLWGATAMILNEFIWIAREWKS